MATLGTPARVTYRAARYQTGWTDLYAIVERPDGRQVFITLNEKPTPFLGVYENFLITRADDPPGDYLVQIVGPNEGIREITKITFNIPPASQQSVDQLNLRVQNMIDILEIFTL